MIKPPLCIVFQMNFSASADYLGEGRYLQRRSVKQYIHMLTFRAEDEVLDVGCGSGEETRAIAKKVKSVTGNYIFHLTIPINLVETFCRRE